MDRPRTQCAGHRIVGMRSALRYGARIAVWFWGLSRLCVFAVDGGDMGISLPSWNACRINTRRAEETGWLCRSRSSKRSAFRVYVCRSRAAKAPLPRRLLSGIVPPALARTSLVNSSFALELGRMCVHLERLCWRVLIRSFFMIL
jgi:hypothetical protein